MSNEAAAALAIIITGLLAAFWNWNVYVRRLPLSRFGLENVRRVLISESPARRHEILQRGWMTSHEWTEINRRHAQAITAELKRRSVNFEEELQRLDAEEASRKEER